MCADPLWHSFVSCTLNLWAQFPHEPSSSQKLLLSCSGQDWNKMKTITGTEQTVADFCSSICYLLWTSWNLLLCSYTPIFTTDRLDKALSNYVLYFHRVLYCTQRRWSVQQSRDRFVHLMNEALSMKRLWQSRLPLTSVCLILRCAHVRERICVGLPIILLIVPCFESPHKYFPVLHSLMINLLTCGEDKCLSYCMM